MTLRTDWVNGQKVYAADMNGIGLQVNQNATDVANALSRLTLLESATVVTSWANLTGKPTSFPPSAHAHNQTDINGLPDRLTAIESSIAGGSATLTWATLTGKPTTFTPSAHSHASSDVTGLDNALASKVAVVLYSGSLTVARPTAAAVYWVDFPSAPSNAQSQDIVSVAGGSSSGDMQSSVYDPTSKAADAFNQDNMVDGTNNKNYSAADKAKVANLSGTNTGDQDLSGKVDKVNGKGLSTNDYTTAEQTKVANLSGVNTGDQTSVTGNAGTATKLATPRAINGVNFDGSAAISVPPGVGTFATTPTANGATTLVYTSAETQQFTGTSNQNVALPTTSVVQNQHFKIVNASTGAVTVLASDFSTVAVVAAGYVLDVYAKVATPTNAASGWQITSYVPGSAINVAQAATASTVAQRDVNSRISAYGVIHSGSSVATAAATTTMTVATQDIMVLTGTTTQTVKLPTTSVVIYQRWTFINTSTGTVTITSSNGDTVKSLAAGATTTVTALQAVPTAGTHWYAS